jgi:16S rRNA pseudouridine516 synthase
LRQGVELRNESGSFAATDVIKIAEHELQMNLIRIFLLWFDLR